MPTYRIEGRLYEADTPEDAYRQHAKAPKTPGLILGTVQQFNQGLSLGGADEIGAGFEAMTGGSYADSMARQKAERASFAAEHPILSGVAVAGGAVAPVIMSTLAGGAAGGPPGAAAAATGTGTRAMQLTRQALGMEGAQAVGRANTVLQAAREGARAAAVPGMVSGGLSADPNNRDMGTITGGLFGVGTGAALGGGVQVAQNLGARVTPYLQRVAQALGVREVGASFAVAPRGGGGGNVTPITADEAMILQRMEEGGVAPEMAAEVLRRARQAGVPLMLVDVGGQPLQRQARGIRSLPGQGSAVIEGALKERAAGAPARIVQHVERGIGRKASGSGAATEDALLRQSRTSSRGLYEQLKTLPPIKDVDMAELFKIPAVRDIVQRSEANAARFGKQVAPMYDNAGNLIREPTFIDINRVKRNLDELLSPNYNRGPRPVDAPALATAEERKLANEVRKRLLRLADNAPGGNVYREARQRYATPAAARDQYQEGLRFTRKDVSGEDVRAQRTDATAAERKWYDRGVAEAIRSRVMSVDDLAGQPNTLRQFWGNPEARSKLLNVVPERRADMLQQRLSMENEAAQTNAFVRSGSQTADKAAEAIDVAADLIGTAPGGPRAVAAAAAHQTWQRVRARLGENTRTRVAEHLVNMDTDQQLAFLLRLADLQSRGQVNAKQIATLANVVTRQAQAAK